MKEFPLIRMQTSRSLCTLEIAFRALGFPEFVLCAHGQKEMEVCLYEYNK